MMPEFIPPTFDEIIEMATEHLLLSGGHIPTVFAVGTKNVAVMIGDLPDTNDGRQAMMQFLGYHAAEENIGQLRDVFVVMEAWMARLDPDETELTVMPSEHPSRIEVLVLNHYNLRSSRLHMVVYQMIRDADDTLSDLVKINDTRTDRGAGHPESNLISAFIDGYHAGRRGRLPRAGGPRG